MSVRMPVRRVAIATVASLSLLVLGSCSSGDGAEGSPLTGSPVDGQDGTAEPVADDVPAPEITSNIAVNATDVAVSTLVEVSVDGGELTSVSLSSPVGQVSGRMDASGASWIASERLEPGVTYRVKAVAEGEGGTTRDRRRFSTDALSLDEQTFASVAPLQGETVGVGMPVVVTFDLPVRNRAEYEQHMSVTSTPEQAGSWHWMSETEVHWRPQTYWKAGTDVSVDVDVNGLAAGGGIYGQESRTIDFSVGDAHIYKVDAETHQMKVFASGKLLRTLPITTGKAGFITRSGVKVIMEKFESRRMNSETVGIPAGSAEAYDIDNVQYAMRLTNSGEFIHAAPWSVGSQGSANVSHGCTGLSTADAAWLYQMTLRGDVVEYVGTNRPMEFTNGYGDWNRSFAQYSRGSAI